MRIQDSYLGSRCIDNMVAYILPVPIFLIVGFNLFPKLGSSNQGQAKHAGH